MLYQWSAEVISSRVHGYDPDVRPSAWNSVSKETKVQSRQHRLAQQVLAVITKRLAAAHVLPCLALHDYRRKEREKKKRGKRILLGHCKQSICLDLQPKAART